MAAAPLATVIELGTTILRAKQYILAFYFLWFWDYVLTFEEEIQYAWKGKKSWVFVLFLLNRYWPLPYLLWAFFASFWPGYSQTACDKTAFLSIFYFSFATLFAQATVTLRLYAITGKNRAVVAVFVCISVVQMAYGCYVWVAVRKLGSQHWPPIPYDSFRLCFFNQPQTQAVVIMTLSLVYDLLAFLTVVWVSRKHRPDETRLKVPTILDNIVKDATVYFLVIFGTQVLVECFVLFAPSTYHLLPANSSAVFVPIMAGRLMLSLKRSADSSGSPSVDESKEVTDVMFAGHTTMELAMEVGVLRSRRDQNQTAEVELENRVGG